MHLSSTHHDRGAGPSRPCLGIHDFTLCRDVGSVKQVHPMVYELSQIYRWWENPVKVANLIREMNEVVYIENVYGVKVGEGGGGGDGGRWGR